MSFPRALVLLSGSVRAAAFQTAIDRSLLELPISSDEALLDHWKRQAASLLASEGTPDKVELRVLADHLAPLPSAGADEGRVKLTMDRDPSELRGTGGVLRDLSDEYDDDDYLLIAGGAQLLSRPLCGLLSDLSAPGADVTIASHNDGTPSSLMLIRCGCLKVLPRVGFVDMKEQALPIIAKRYCVRVRRYSDRTSLPLRTESQYIAALRWYHGASRNSVTAWNAFEEDWDRRFSLVEDGAMVESGAQIHDSVVLRGARVGRNAAVVRSVVCKGGAVARDCIVTDSLLGPAARHKAGS